MPIMTPLHDGRAFLDLLTARHCKRAFLDRPVPRELLAEVLRAAANAPSTRNNQPWQVAVLTGAARDELSRRLCADFDAGLPARQDYGNRPGTPGPRDAERAQESGAGVFAAKGIARDDEAARRAHHRDNFLFYGAPVELIFHLAADAAPGNFLEMGFFVQNVMLGLVACGLGSCPQYSVAGYPDTLRRALGLGPERLIVCGMAVGYPDAAAPVNAYHPPRASLEEYTRWLDQELPT
jgi:nitroreductase